MSTIRLNPQAAFATLILMLAAFLAAFPMVWMVSVSFMSPGETSQFPPPLFPKHASLANYQALFAKNHMGHYVLNSLLVASLATVLSLAFNVTAGYAFAKLQFKGRDRIFKEMLAALVIPGQLSMMPLFFMLKHMGLLNTYAGALLPFTASLFGIFLVRQYALSIPDEMLQAARIDGASEFQIFTKIVLPNLTPIMATLAIYTFLAAWNDFLWPLIVLSDDQYFTLPLALATLSREHVQEDGLMMAGATVTIVPVLLVFLVLQRHYVRGLLQGSVKG